MVPMAPPAFCQKQGFSTTNCFDCIRSNCYFERLPDREHVWTKPTKDNLRQRGLLPRLPRRRGGRQVVGSLA